MKIYKLIKVVQKIDNMIVTESTGDENDFSIFLGISVDELKKYLQLMKIFNASIYYCDIRNSYCYEQKGHFNIGFIDLNENKTTKTKMKLRFNMN